MLHFRFLLVIISQREISTEEIALISYVIFFTLILTTMFVVFFVTFQRRKSQLLLDKINQQKQFDEELVKTQQEIQDETLKHVGRELHDNVGQIMVYATMQLNQVVNKVSDDLKPKAQEASKALKESLEEVRALSKSLNSDVIYNLGFEKTLSNEINRLNRIGRLEARLTSSGNRVNFENKKDEIILFRILQEFFSNTIKYAEAQHLQVVLNYTPEHLHIEVKDDGVGFDMSSVVKGSGLINMEKRAELIHAAFHLMSEKEKGTTLTISYPFKLD